MRASMAIPAVFSPVRIDSCVLVDGGMRNNFPVDIARKMGADIVIGISVHDHPMTVDDVWGTMSVLSQIVDANTKNKFEENKAATDVFMYVDPEGYGAASFSAAAIDTLIRRGEEEAMRHWDELIALKKRIGISKNYRPKLLHPLSPEVMTDKHRVVDFEFVNMTPQDERFLRQKFHFAKMDSIYAAKEQEIATSMRMDLFYQSAECRLIPKDSGCVVRMVAGSRKTTRMYAGFRYAFTSYKVDIIRPNYPDPVWKSASGFWREDMACNMHWAEIVFGVDAKLIGPLHLGWTVRYKRRIAHKDGDLGTTWYVPGFGINDKDQLAANFNVIIDI